MRTVIKNKQPIVKAWQLGRNSAMEQKLLREGKLRCAAPGQYEVFSQEALGKTGELAAAGDYFKVDNAGFPLSQRADVFRSQPHPSGRR